MNEQQLLSYMYYGDDESVYSDIDVDEMSDSEDDYETCIIRNIQHNGKRVETHEEEERRVSRETKRIRTLEKKNVDLSVDNAMTKLTPQKEPSKNQGTTINNTNKKLTPCREFNMEWMDVPLSNEYEAYQRPQWRKLYVPNATGKTFAT